MSQSVSIDQATGSAMHYVPALQERAKRDEWQTCHVFEMRIGKNHPIDLNIISFQMTRLDENLPTDMLT